jgi:hypothetical protein
MNKTKQPAETKSNLERGRSFKEGTNKTQKGLFQTPNGLIAIA